MKQQFLSPAASKNRNRDLSLALYIFALALEAVLLYCAFSLASLEYVPPHFRFIGASAFFLGAALAAWWGGSIFLRRKHEIRQHTMLLFSTLPVRIFLGVSLAIVVVSLFALFGHF